MGAIEDIPVASPSSLTNPVPGGQAQDDASKVMGNVTLGPTEVRRDGGPSTSSTASGQGDTMAQPSPYSSGNSIQGSSAQENTQQAPTLQSGQAPSSAPVDISELEAEDAIAREGGSSVSSGTNDKKMGWWQNISNRFFSSVNRTDEGSAQTLLNRLQNQGSPNAKTKVENGDILYQMDPSSQWQKFDPKNDVLEKMYSFISRNMNIPDRYTAAGLIKRAIYGAQKDPKMPQEGKEVAASIDDADIVSQAVDVFKNADLSNITDIPADIADTAGDVVEGASGVLARLVTTPLLAVVGGLAATPAGPAVAAGVSALSGYVGGAVLAGAAGNAARDEFSKILGVPVDEYNPIVEAIKDGTYLMGGDILNLGLTAGMKAAVGKGKESALIQFFQHAKATLGDMPAAGQSPANKALKLTALLTDAISRSNMGTMAPKVVLDAFSGKEGILEQKLQETWIPIKAMAKQAQENGVKAGIKFTPDKTISKIQEIAATEGWKPQKNGLFNAAQRISNAKKSSAEMAGLEDISMNETLARLGVKKQETAAQQQLREAISGTKMIEDSIPGNTAAVFKDPEGYKELIDMMDTHDRFVRASRDDKFIDFENFTNKEIPSQATKGGYAKAQPVFDSNGNMVVSPSSGRKIEEAEYSHRKIRDAMRDDSTKYVISQVGDQAGIATERGLEKMSEAITFNKAYGWLITHDGGGDFADHLLQKKNIDVFNVIKAHFGEDSKEVEMIKSGIVNNMFDKMTDDGTKIFNSARFMDYYGKNNTVLKEVMDPKDLRRMMAVQSIFEKSVNKAGGEFNEKTQEDMFVALGDLYKLWSPFRTTQVRTLGSFANRLFNVTQNDVTRARFVANNLLPKYISSAKSEMKRKSLIKVRTIFQELMDNSSILPGPNGQRVMHLTSRGLQIYDPIKHMTKGSISPDEIDSSLLKQQDREMEQQKQTKPQE